MVRIPCTAVVVASLVPFHLAFAADGVIEINQAIAQRGAVNGDLVADPAGFPVIITQPGSYRLTGNLDVRVAADPQNVHGISVAVNDVSIDLNGFAIYGPTVCTGAPPAEVLSCAPTGSGIGINANLRNNVSISGGVVNGAGRYGVLCGQSCRIERMHVENSGLHGISAADGSLIVGNTSRRNQSSGLGFTSQGGVTYRGNSAVENGGNGITPGGSDTIEGNTVRENRGQGISANPGCTVVGNTVRSNFGAGIAATTGSLVIDNTVYLNTGIGLSLGAFVGYGRNAIYGNTGGEVSGGREIAPNLCGNDLICQ
jgi:parallel beta-helix repeat protein